HVFNPNFSHSGTSDFSMPGPYVLNLLVRPDEQPPEVVSVTQEKGVTVDGPPTRLIIQFREEVNVPFLAYFTQQQTTDGKLEAVYVLGSDGERYYPRLESYDPSTSKAFFIMYDGVPPGLAELHLAGKLPADVDPDGRLGVTDFA